MRTACFLNGDCILTYGYSLAVERLLKAVSVFFNRCCIPTHASVVVYAVFDVAPTVGGLALGSASAGGFLGGRLPIGKVRVIAAIDGILCSRRLLSGSDTSRHGLVLAVVLSRV